MPNIGPMGLIIVLVIALLILGPKRLRPPEQESAHARALRTGRVLRCAKLSSEPACPVPRMNHRLRRWRSGA